MRGPVERFNPQIHTEDNSLTTLMAKDFAVERKTFDLFKKYNKFQSWIYNTGRVNQGVQSGKMKRDKSINDNAYRISYEGMNILPAYSFGKAYIGGYFDAANPSPDISGQAGAVAYTGGIDATKVETDVPGSIAIAHDPDNGVFGDKFNPNDRMNLDNGLGLQFLIQKPGRASADKTNVVYDGKFIGEAPLFDEAHLADGNVLGEGGSAFGEGSMKGSQRTSRNKWRINYSVISRYTLTMTGSAASQKVAKIWNGKNQNESSWEFAEVMKADEMFRMFNELSLRFSRTTMNPETHSWYENYGTNKLSLSGFRAESGMTAPIIGEGWIPQIQDNATFDYNPNNGLVHTLIEALLNVLATRSPAGTDNNEFLAVTDRIGRTAFDRGMKKLLQFDSGNGGGNNIVYNITTGQDVTLGFNVTTYEYLNNKITIIEDEIFNHPGLFPTNGGLVGTGNIYIINTTSVDGVGNFEIISRQEREHKRKFVDGMTSFDPSSKNSSHAASGFDGCAVHMLSEQMAVLYDTRSCGILKASAVWDGGDLNGTTIAGQKATDFIF